MTTTFRVSVDVVNRYVVDVPANDAQDALLQIERGEVRAEEGHFVVRRFDLIHVVKVDQKEVKR